jgi:uncharacterized protein YjdB
MSILRLKVRSLATLLGLALTIAGCGGRSVVDTITITADHASISAGQTVQLHATDSNNLGQSTDVTAKVTWASSNAPVATVSTSGLLSGLTAGSANISASLGGKTGLFPVTIAAPVVTGIRLTPATASLYTGGTQQYTATATYQNNTTGDVSASVVWSATPATMATISKTGLLTAIAPGTYSVNATLGTQSAAASGTITDAPLTGIVISPPGASIPGGTTQQFTATGSYADKSTRDITGMVTWSSSNPAVLAINAAGLGTAGASSTATVVAVTAQLGAVTATANATVTASVSLTQLYVEPTSSSIATGTAERHTAVANYSDGSTRDVSAQVTWSVNGSTPGTGAPSPAAARAVHANADSGSGVATIAQTGIDHAIAPGSAMVQASLGGKTALSTVLVTSATLVSLTASSSTPYFPAGTMQPIILSGTFSDGTSQDLSLSAVWTSSNPAVATIGSDTGIVNGIGSGTSVFTATLGGKTATQTLTVLPRTLVSLTTRIQSTVAPVGPTQSLSVFGTY